MKTPFFKALGTTAAITTVVATGLIVGSQHGRAESDDSEESQIRIGLKIAAVPLNLNGKNRSLVGLGSYIVNAQGDCNACHNGGPGNHQFLPGGNPFFGQHPTMINPATYVGGGRDFGALDTTGVSAHIVSRNLTPDKTGLPEGGATYEEFLNRIRRGIDDDHFHPTCTGALNSHCVPAPFDGSLLQIMPWPIYGNMTDHDLRAIYEYLSAVPCPERDPCNPAGADTHGHRCH